MNRNRHNSERGATMLAALSFSSVLAISLASYVAISYNTLERVDEKVTAASELLEGQNVLEETLYSVSSENLTDWSLDGNNASKTVTGVDIATLAEAMPIDFTETVTITPAPKPQPTIPSAFTSLFRRLGFRMPEPEPVEEVVIDEDAVELELVGLNDGSDVRTLSLTQKTVLDDGSIETRVLSATMAPIAPFQAAIVANHTIRMRRNGTINSYDSSQGAYGRNNQGAEAVLAGNYVSISRAQVSGYASSAARNPYFGRRASLQGPESNQRVNVDTARIIPTPYQPNLDTVASSGVGSLYGGPNTTLGTPNSSEPRLYYARDLTLRNNERITINGPTHLIVDGNINLYNSSAIVVRDGASLEIHVDGNVNLDGDGIINLSEVPANVAIIGTNSRERSITFRGDEPLHAAIYAPKSNFYAYGNRTTRTIYGAIVANRVTFDDDTNFHFDVALRDAHFSGVEKAYAFESGQ